MGIRIGSEKSRPLLFLAACCFALVVSFVSCGNDPRSLRITEANKETFLDEIGDTKGLTVDEVRLLIGYQLRSGMGKAFGVKSESPVGKTVGELIVELRKLAETEKTEAERQRRLAEEAQAKEAALAKELRRSLTLSVYEKSFVDANFMSGRYQDYITIRCIYENTSGKDIRAFRGTVVFQDLFGTEIYRSRLTISDPVKANTRGKWNGQIEYNQFSAEEKRLRNTDLKDLKVVWMPSSIIFDDGTQLGEMSE